MTDSIRVRPLTPEENTYFLTSDLGKQAVSWGPLSIMGLADDPKVEKLDIKVNWQKVYLGGDKFFYDGPEVPLAVGGRVTSVIWDVDTVYTYLFAEAKNLNIPILHEHTYPAKRLYMARRYADALFDSFCYADRALSEWYKNRFFLIRWFDGIQPDWESNEAKAIRDGIGRILVKSKSN